MLQTTESDASVELIAGTAVVVEDDYTHPDSSCPLTLKKQADTPTPVLTHVFPSTNVDTDVIVKKLAQSTSKRVALLDFVNHYVMDNAYVATGTVVYQLLKNIGKFYLWCEYGPKSNHASADSDGTSNVHSEPADDLKLSQDISEASEALKESVEGLQYLSLLWQGTKAKVVELSSAAKSWYDWYTEVFGSDNLPFLVETIPDDSKEVVEDLCASGEWVIMDDPPATRPEPTSAAEDEQVDWTTAQHIISSLSSRAKKLLSLDQPGVWKSRARYAHVGGTMIGANPFVLVGAAALEAVLLAKELAHEKETTNERDGSENESFEEDMSSSTDYVFSDLVQAGSSGRAAMKTTKVVDDYVSASVRSVSEPILESISCKDSKVCRIQTEKPYSFSHSEERSLSQDECSHLVRATASYPSHVQSPTDFASEFSSLSQGSSTSTVVPAHALNITDSELFELQKSQVVLSSDSSCTPGSFSTVLSEGCSADHTRVPEPEAHDEDAAPVLSPHTPVGSSSLSPPLSKGYFTAQTHEAEFDSVHSDSDDIPTRSHHAEVLPSLNSAQDRIHTPDPVRGSLPKVLLKPSPQPVHFSGDWLQSVPSSCTNVDQLICSSSSEDISDDRGHLSRAEKLLESELLPDVTSSSVPATSSTQSSSSLFAKEAASNSEFDLSATDSSASLFQEDSRAINEDGLLPSEENCLSSVDTSVSWTSGSDGSKFDERGVESEQIHTDSGNECYQWNDFPAFLDEDNEADSSSESGYFSCETQIEDETETAYTFDTVDDD